MDSIIRSLKMRKAILLDELLNEFSPTKALELGTVTYRIALSERENLKKITNDFEED